jgi:hypothetical protein
MREGKVHTRAAGHVEHRQTRLEEEALGKYLADLW